MAKAVKPSPERTITFRAPSKVHGAIKQITGRLEMDNVQIAGRVPFERDVMVWLLGELYADGPEKWKERLIEAERKFTKLVESR